MDIRVGPHVQRFLNPKIRTHEQIVHVCTRAGTRSLLRTHMKPGAHQGLDFRDTRAASHQHYLLNLLTNHCDVQRLE